MAYDLKSEIPDLLHINECRDPGVKPEIRWRHKTELYVDDAYQRDLTSRRSQKLIDQIARNFKWQRFGIVQTTERGAIVDGQHRHAAALRRPDIDKVPCMVWDVPPKTAALMFVGLNRDRVAITHQAVFKAELKAGDPVATAIQEMCDELGIVPLTYQKSTRKLAPNETNAVQTIKHQMSVDPKRCRTALQCCVRAKATMSANVLMMTFRELTLGAPVPRVMAMLTRTLADYVPAGSLPVASPEEPPKQTTIGVKRYENGTFMDILLRTFARANVPVEVKNQGAWRVTEFKIDGRWVNLREALTRANELRASSGYAPLTMPR